MATFQNFATLTYNGGVLTSNTVTGELLETLSASKTAVLASYGAGEDVTYVISLLNSGAQPLTNLTVTDDLGGYTFGGGVVYPLEYSDGSLKYYVNGVLQAAPVVSAGAPLVISGINVPAGGNAIIVYEARVTEYAPLASASSIVNTATVTGGGLTTPVVATETVNARVGASLAISKTLEPAVVTENGQITYTFVIENYGNAEAVATDNVVLSDTFDPILNPITVSYNGTVWTEGVNYNYDATTGVFSTVVGQITVPAATYTQNPDGTWTIVPGVATVVVSGTV